MPITKGKTKYRIKDLQFEFTYFGDGAIFNSRKEACEQLMSYYGIDCDLTEENKAIKNKNYAKLESLLSEYGWRIEKITPDKKGGEA